MKKKKYMLLGGGKKSVNAHPRTHIHYTIERDYDYTHHHAVRDMIVAYKIAMETQYN